MAEKNEMEVALERIAEKVKRTVAENVRLRAALAERERELSALQSEIEDKNILINKLEQEKEVINQGNAQSREGDTAEVKRRINQLIEEIDRSLDILSKID